MEAVVNAVGEIFKDQARLAFEMHTRSDVIAAAILVLGAIAIFTGRMQRWLAQAAYALMLLSFLLGGVVAVASFEPGGYIERVLSSPFPIYQSYIGAFSLLRTFFHWLAPRVFSGVWTDQIPHAAA